MQAVGVGPSSRTVGPMRAARRFVGRRAGSPHVHRQPHQGQHDHARHRPGHEGRMPGGRPWRLRRQRHRMLTP
ncbi:serine dehydratase beta chain [Streptomyces sp. NPDC058686]|uniref:serine dehydratase beta chain n=1 Tax=Streptomyces sp. NPDC058686 TaxID=3346599 RepID=UPI00364C7E4C